MCVVFSDGMTRLDFCAADLIYWGEGRCLLGGKRQKQLKSRVIRGFYSLIRPMPLSGLKLCRASHVVSYDPRAAASGFLRLFFLGFFPCLSMHTNAAIAVMRKTFCKKCPTPFLLIAPNVAKAPM